MNFKQTIHIEGRCIEDILRLRCIRSCEKTAIVGIYKFKFFPLLMAHPAQFQSAYTGYLCEDYDGRWHVMNEDTYKKIYGELHERTD